MVCPSVSTVINYHWKNLIILLNCASSELKMCIRSFATERRGTQRVVNFVSTWIILQTRSFNMFMAFSIYVALIELFYREYLNFLNASSYSNMVMKSLFQDFLISAN